MVVIFVGFFIHDMDFSFTDTTTVFSTLFWNFHFYEIVVQQKIFESNINILSFAWAWNSHSAIFMIQT